jgi:monooxygenase
VRWKNVLLTMAMFQLSRRRPELVKKALRKGVTKLLPAGFPIDEHFRPTYDPWDQRLCLVPDGDLFRAMRSGKVTIATGGIERFTGDGLRLKTGEEVRADVVVTATGLVVKLFGGAELVVDGEPIVPANRLIYKGMMLGGVPNFFLSFGYTNASWTLRSDVTARAAARILNHMKRRGFTVCTPLEPATVERQPVINFSSGYVQRALPFLPKQGSRPPWAVPQNYIMDCVAMRFTRIDADLKFSRNETAVRA